MEKNESQFKLQEKLLTDSFTRDDYKKLDKSRYNLIDRIDMCREYNYPLYIFFYMLWILSICIVSSLLAVYLAVK